MDSALEDRNLTGRASQVKIGTTMRYRGGCSSRDSSLYAFGASAVLRATPASRFGHRHGKIPTGYPYRAFPNLHH